MIPTTHTEPKPPEFSIHVIRITTGEKPGLGPFA